MILRKLARPFLAMCASRSPFCTDATKLRNIENGLTGQFLNFTANIAHFSRFFYKTFQPLPVRRPTRRAIGLFIALVLLEEILARHTSFLRQTQAGFQPDQTLVNRKAAQPVPRCGYCYQPLPHQ